ncbi:hypothetical protein [Saccharopolyspora gregorii]|uniref:MFS transporter n=1 Tax=Saccharopolyspora gregorii TaxID=33914 RepID=A0ABP6RQD6_9PSEU
MHSFPHASEQEPATPVLDGALRKAFRRLVPLVMIMFVANYIDRVNIGFAKDALEADSGIGAAAFGLGAGLFFLTYAVFEVPSNILLERCCSSSKGSRPSSSDSSPGVFWKRSPPTRRGSATRRRRR